MNNIYDINSSRYSFKVGLTNSNNRGLFVPLNKSSIKELLIEDTLSFVGLRGVIKIINYYGIMQKFEALDIMPGNNILVIDIENLDPQIINAKPLRLRVECLLGEAIDYNDNVIDKTVTISFEELNVGILRTKYFSPEQINSLNAGSATDYIKEVVKAGHSIEDANEAFSQVDDTCAPAPIGGIFTKSQSCYDLLRFFYRNCYYEDGIPSLVTTEQIEEGGDIISKISVKNLGTFFSGFFNKLNNPSGVNIDLSEYLMETFIAGGADTGNTFADNYIDKYDIYRPNFLELLSTKWVDYNIAPNPDFTGVTSGDIFKYEDARKMFEYKILGKTVKSNLPAPPPPDSVNNALITTAPIVREWKDGIKAAVMRSFIFDNLAIIFNVKGLPYRRSGFFIRMILDKNEEDKKISQDLTGFYFVISIKHLFNGNNYTNEIVAVKVYLNNDTLSQFNTNIPQVEYNQNNTIDLGVPVKNTIDQTTQTSKLFTNFGVKRNNFTGSSSKLSSDEPGER